jgi:uncharacterized membrane protein
MLALRYVYVLALAIWLGGMAVLGALVAPTPFDVLRATAPETGASPVGEVFETTIARFHYVAYACGGALVVTLTAMALLGPRPSGFAFRLALSGAMLLVALYSGFAIIGEMDARRLMMVNIAGALVLLYWEARDRL